jgi:glycosyltransferase involved in cell wall biosynthesis
VEAVHGTTGPAQAETRGIRVLTIAHNAVAASNRARSDALRHLPGVDVVLITPPWWHEEGRRVAARPAEPWWRVGRTLFTGNGTRHVYLSEIARAIRELQPDVIDLYEEPFSLVALQSLLLRDRLAPDAALVFYSAVNVHRQWRWPYRAIERLVLRRADAAHAPNSEVPRILAARGFAQKPVRVIPLGVDIDRFASAEALDLRTIGRPRIGFVGRFEPVKGLDVLLDAFGRLTTPAELVLVGDGSLRPALLGHRAHVLPSVPFEQVPSLLKALDVLVLPSVTILPLHREQFGRVLAEAMAAGVPVIGSSSGAIPEVIGDAGLVVPERDPHALSQAIAAVLGDGDVRKRLIERGLQRAASQFAWSAVAEQTLALFRVAMAQRNGAASLQGLGA